jgi:hypothetical protein
VGCSAGADATIPRRRTATELVALRGFEPRFDG